MSILSDLRRLASRRASSRARAPPVSTVTTSGSLPTSGPLPTLPSELYIKILSYLDLHSLAMISRANVAWYRLALPLLFRDVVVDGPEQLAQFFYKPSALRRRKRTAVYDPKWSLSLVRTFSYVYQSRVWSRSRPFLDQERLSGLAMAFDRLAIVFPPLAADPTGADPNLAFLWRITKPHTLHLRALPGGGRLFSLRTLLIPLGPHLKRLELQDMVHEDSPADFIGSDGALEEVVYILVHVFYENSFESGRRIGRALQNDVAYRKPGARYNFSVRTWSWDVDSTRAGVEDEAEAEAIEPVRWMDLPSVCALDLALDSSL